MKKIMKERIITSAEQPLTQKDRKELIAKRNKKAFYVFSAYIPLALFLVYIFFGEPSVVYRDNYPYPKHKITDDDLSNNNIAAPLVCGFFFLLLTGFFIQCYLQTVGL